MAVFIHAFKQVTSAG